MSLSLVAAILLGTTACTAVVVPENPTATVKLLPQGVTDELTPSDAEQPQEPATEQAPSNTDTPAVAAPQNGTEYFQANQRFSPVLDKWVIDGTTASFKQYSCTGSVTAEGIGTLAPTGYDDGSLSLTWDPDVTGVEAVGRQLEITDRYLSQITGIDDGAAIVDKKKAAVNFTKMCGELGDTVLKLMF